MTADTGVVEPCRGCGATLAAGAAWCTQCYLPRAAAVPAPSASPEAGVPGVGERSIIAGTNVQAAAAGPRPMVATRWRKTPTTFGPLGRVLCTLALLVPLPVLVLGTVVSGGLEIVGLGIWVFVLMPWALRDIWKAGSLPAE